MLVSLKFNNAFVFSREQLFSLKADMRNKRLASNVITAGNHTILKSACIYGSNNSGKTCLVRIIRAVWSVILNQPGTISPNIFSDNPVVSISCGFIQNEKEWVYSFKFNSVSKEFVYEKFSKIDYDAYKNQKEESYFVRDFEKNEFHSLDDKLNDNLTLLSKNNILIHTVDTSSLEYLKEAKEVLTSFANRIVIVDMNNIPLGKTISMLKKHDESQQDIVSFIKNADLDLDDFKYQDNKNIHLKVEPQDNARPLEDVLADQFQQNVEDSLRLTSYYKGHPVPSLLYDSTGTKKMAALASYVVDALRKGQILVIDELDSSIHFKLTRSIVSMFNNELNDTAQLIFTAHDISLMDCKKLFRKEQIWFVHKDKEGVYLYSLASFTAEEGVRETSDIIEKYKRGVLGAVPEPDMLKTLLQVKNE
jgi:uncharacterized protein